MWAIFNVFTEFVTILLLFYVLVFWPRGMWDLSSTTRDRTRTPCIGRRSLNHWTTREVPRKILKAAKGEEKDTLSSIEQDWYSWFLNRSNGSQKAMTWHIKALQVINLLTYNCTPRENVLQKWGQNNDIFNKKQMSPLQMVFSQDSPSPEAAPPTVTWARNLGVISDFLQFLRL